MLAKYEKRSLVGENFSLIHSYRNLQNLPHWHVEHELIYISSGSAELMINNEYYTLMEGQGAFIQSKEVHYIKSSLNTVVYVVKIAPSLVENIVGNMTLLNPVLEKYYDLSGIFEEILRENTEKLEYSGIITDSCVVRMVALVYRNNEKELIETSLNKGERRYKELLKYVSENYSTVTFEEAAGFMGYTEPYFSKYFRQLSGMKFTKYLNILKVTGAISLIEEGEKSMTEIADECGFNTIRSFNRVFKEITEYSPGKLPKGYVLVDNFGDFESMEFDPTLNVTETLV